VSTSPEQPPRTLGSSSSNVPEDATVAPPPSALVTSDYVAKPETSSKLPTQLPSLFGRYQLQKLLGQGGMGAVYLAHDTQLDRSVALKIPIFSAEEGSQVLARFYREARAAATILHANVCPIYDVGEVDDVPYLTMGYIEGKSLAEWIRGKPLTPRQSAVLVRKLALALQEAHKKGVIHRDLKPANIMIDNRGEPIIMDFGLARRTRPGDPRLTQKGAVMGTPAYMPPEQVSGNPEVIGPACDIYSLGVILYELVTGRLPFHGDPMAMLSQVLLNEPPPPSQWRPDLDAALESICLKAMAKKVEHRYASMAELTAALQDYLRRGSPTLAPAPVKATNTVKPARQNAEVVVSGAANEQTIAQPETPRISKAERKPARRRLFKRGRSLWPGVVGAAVAVALLSSVAFLLLRHRGGPVGELDSDSLPAPPASFVPLFNEKDLSAWETASGDPAAWGVADGTMVFTLTDPPRQRGWLVTQHDYTDFILRFEFQLAPGANSGVGLRMWPGAPKPLEIQIQDDTFNAFAAQRPIERTGALYGLAGQPAQLRPLGEWNQMEIELRGWSLRVAVNGKETLRTMLNDDEVVRYLNGAPPTSGRIGLQHWLGSARFRKLEVKDLSGGEDAAAKRENP
jgi:serine/threonine protein kinase